MNPYSFKISQIVLTATTGDYRVNLNRLGHLIGDSTIIGWGNIIHLLDIVKKNEDEIIDKVSPPMDKEEKYADYYITVPAALRMLEAYCEGINLQYDKKEHATIKGIIAKINEFMEGK